MPYTAQDIDDILNGRKSAGNFLGNIKRTQPTVTSGLNPNLNSGLASGIAGGVMSIAPLTPKAPAVQKPIPVPAINQNPFKNPLEKTLGTTTNAAGQIMPKYTPPVNPDADLTPQEILKKYQAISGDNSISNRDALLKQGYNSLNNIARQQVTIPLLRPKINGTVNQDEIAQAMQLRDELARQSKPGAAALSFVNSASFGQLKNPALGNTFAPDAVSEQRAAIQRAEQAQPAASGVGKFAGEALKYGATAGFVNEIPAVQALTKGKLPARLLAGRLTDIVPDVVTAKQETDNTADFVKNLTINQVTGLAFDGALEGIGAAARGIVKKVTSNQPISNTEVSQLRNAISDGIKKGDIDTDAVARSIANQEVSARPAAKSVQQPIPRAPEPIQPQPIPNAPRINEALGSPNLQEKVKTGPAIWANKDVDQPVNITGYAGELNGRQYVNVKGSNSAIPVDEIKYSAGYVPQAPRATAGIAPQPVPRAASAEAPTFGKNTVGAAERQPGTYSYMQKEFGVFKPGEAPRAREVDVPLSTTGTDKVSRFTRTTMESKATPDSIIQNFEDGVAKGDFSYNPKTDKKALDAAVSTLEYKGYADSLKQWDDVVQGRRLGTKDDMVLGQVLYSEAANAGDSETAMKLAAEIAAEGTRLGQNVQALRMMKKLTPEGKLYYVQKSADNIKQELIKKYGKNAPNIEIDQGLVDNYLAAAKGAGKGEAQEVTSVVGAEIEKALKEISDIGSLGIKPKNENVPVEDWMTEVGNELAGLLEKRTIKSAPKQQPITRTILSDLTAFAENYALPKRAKVGSVKRTATDRITDYFNNREQYAKAWKQAQNAFIKKNASNAQMLDAFEEWLQGTISYNATGSDQVMLKAIAETALAEDVAVKQIILRSSLGDKDELVKKLLDRIIQETGATGADVQVLNDAVLRYVNETAANSQKNAGQLLEGDIAAELKSMGEKISSLIRRNQGDKNAISAQVADALVSKYGISKQSAEQSAKKIIDKFNEVVLERSQKELKRIASTKPAPIKKTFEQKFQELANMGAFSSAEYSDAITKKLFGTSVSIDKELVGKVTSGNEAAMREALEAIIQNIADQVPATWLEKWNAWRYLSMLGNPKTHIRNLLGNAVFTPARKIKNIIGTGLESAFKISDRTKAILTPADSSLKKFASSDFSNVKDLITEGGKLNPETLIQSQKKIFDTVPLEKIRKFNSAALEWEDGLFLKGAYSDSLAQYMKANKYSADFLSSGSREAKIALEKARKYAILEAQKATYRDASKVANALNRFKKTNAVTNIIGEGLMPFTKTPINILKRGVEYSPAGLIKGITYDLAKVKSGEKTAAQAIDDIAAGLTGTGIIALGAWLASKGIVTGGNPENKKESAFGILQGEQNYAIKIGDKSYTIDWMAPVSLPFFVGVEVFNQENNGDAESSIARIIDSMTSVSEPMINMSMLQGINSAIKTAGYSESPVTDIGLNTLTGYLGQAVPTASGQVARAIDPFRRSAYVQSGSPLPAVQRQIQNSQAKIPLASQKLQPKVDQWGRTQENTGGSLIGRLAYNSLSPGYISESKTTPLDQHISELYKATSDTQVLPGTAPKYFTVNKEKYNLSGDEYTKYSQLRGQISYEVASSLLNDSRYKTMDDQTKADSVKDAYEFANEIAKNQVNPNYEIKGWVAKAIDSQNQGIDPSTYIAIKNTSNLDGENGTTQAELSESLFGTDLTADQKAYIYKLENPKSKINPFEKMQELGLPQDVYARYYQALIGVKSSKRPNGKTISGSLERNRRKALMDAGATLQEANAYIKAMYDYE